MAGGYHRPRRSLAPRSFAGRCRSARRSRAARNDRASSRRRQFADTLCREERNGGSPGGASGPGIRGDLTSIPAANMIGKNTTLWQNPLLLGDPAKGSASPAPDQGARPRYQWACPGMLINYNQQFWQPLAELLFGAAALAFLTWICFWLRLDTATTVRSIRSSWCCCPSGAESSLLLLSRSSLRGAWITFLAHRFSVSRLAVRKISSR